MPKSKRLDASKISGADAGQKKKAKRQEEGAAKVKVENHFEKDTDDEEDRGDRKLHGKSNDGKGMDVQDDKSTEDKAAAVKQETDDEAATIKQETDDENEAENDEKTFVWSSYKKFLLLLPMPVYRFWASLIKCKTWGEVRTLCAESPANVCGFPANSDFYRKVLVQRYKRNHEHFQDSKFDEEDLMDSKSFSPEDCDHVMNGLGEGECEAFPFYIEKIQLYCAGYGYHWWDVDDSPAFMSGVKQYAWMKKVSSIFTAEAGGPYFYGLYFKLKDKDTILAKISEMGCIAKHEPNLSEFTGGTCAEWFTYDDDDDDDVQ